MVRKGLQTNHFMNSPEKDGKVKAEIAALQDVAL